MSADVIYAGNATVFHLDDLDKYLFRRAAEMLGSTPLNLQALTSQQLSDLETFVRTGAVDAEGRMQLNGVAISTLAADRVAQLAALAG